MSLHRSDEFSGGIERLVSNFQRAAIMRATLPKVIGRHSLGRMVRNSERSAIAVIEFFENGSRQKFEVEESRQHKMAKYRHKTFEMFDFSDEATCALASKSTRPVAYVDDPESWSFQRLVAFHAAGVLHVKFKKGEYLAAEFSLELRNDFSQLADSLVNDSRVLLDFDSLSEFSSGCIDELSRFNAKLQSKGSRIVLCNLETAVRSSFFPHRRGNDRTSSGVS